MLGIPVARKFANSVQLRQTSSSRHENYNFQFHEYRDERMRSRMRARNVSGARDVKKAAR